MLIIKQNKTTTSNIPRGKTQQADQDRAQYGTARLRATIIHTTHMHTNNNDAAQDSKHCETYAAFTCYRNYRKYEFPNRKLDVNSLSSRIYYWEILKYF